MEDHEWQGLLSTESLPMILFCYSHTQTYIYIYIYIYINDNPL